MKPHTYIRKEEYNFMKNIWKDKFIKPSKISTGVLKAIDEAEELSVTTITQQQEASKRHQKILKTMDKVSKNNSFGGEEND